MSVKVKAKAGAIVLVPLIYAIFCLSSAIAGVVGLASFLTGSTKALSRITHAMDVLAAAQLSVFFPAWSGRTTVGAECGSDIECKFCSWLCGILNWMEDRHCERAADIGE